MKKTIKNLKIFLFEEQVKDVPTSMIIDIEPYSKVYRPSSFGLGPRSEVIPSQKPIYVPVDIRNKVFGDPFSGNYNSLEARFEGIDENDGTVKWGKFNSTGSIYDDNLID